MKANLLSLRAIDRGGHDFVGHGNTIATASGVTRLNLNMKLSACSTYNLSERFKVREEGASSPPVCSANAVIDPTDPHPSIFDVNVSLASYTYDRQIFPKATAREMGVSLAAKSRTFEGCRLR